MKPLFKNVTKYTDNNFQQFVNFHTNKFNLRYNFYTIIMSILIAYCAILGITQKSWGICLLFTAMLIAFLIMRIYIPAKEYRMNKERFSNNKSTLFSYDFFKWYFIIDKYKVYYIKLNKVIETKDYFYLYINEDTAYLVSKSGFKLGTPEEFSEFIRKKCILKYNKEKPDKSK